MRGVWYPATSFEDSRYISGDAGWSAPYLYAKAEELKLKPELVCLRHLDLNRQPWSMLDEESNFDAFCFHCRRMLNADTSIPIILAWDGAIMDGFHRVARAIAENKRTIKAYRFDDYVKPDQERKDDEGPWKWVFGPKTGEEVEE